jgi:serine/threonine protein kinase
MSSQRYFEKVGRSLGGGSYGSVYEAVNDKGVKVAVKKITFGKTYCCCRSDDDSDYECMKDDGSGEEQTPYNCNEKLQDVLNEKFILKEVTHHPNMVGFLDFYEGERDAFLIFELYPNDLKQFIRAKGNLELDLIKKFSRQLLNGLSFLQTKGIMHRDLKPENIMVDSNLNLKITDFGLSVSKFNRYYDIYNFFGCETHQIQTLWYRAPEILLGVKRYSKSIDTWSVGCIIAEMIDGKILFNGDSEIDQLFKIFKIKGTPHNKDWKNVEDLPCYKSWFPQFQKKEKIKDTGARLEDLLQRLLEYHPERRIHPYQAIDHHFFRD